MTFIVQSVLNVQHTDSFMTFVSAESQYLYLWSKWIFGLGLWHTQKTTINLRTHSTDSCGSLRRLHPSLRLPPLHWSFSKVEEVAPWLHGCVDQRLLAQSALTKNICQLAASKSFHSKKHFHQIICLYAGPFRTSHNSIWHFMIR